MAKLLGSMTHIMETSPLQLYHGNVSIKWFVLFDFCLSLSFERRWIVTGKREVDILVVSVLFSLFGRGRLVI